LEHSAGAIDIAQDDVARAINHPPNNSDFFEDNHLIKSLTLKRGLHTPVALPANFGLAHLSRCEKTDQKIVKHCCG